MSNGLTFGAAYRVGAWAEAEVARYYQGLGHAVRDGRSDVLMRLLDTDFIIEGVGWVEVKADRYATGNFYIERTSNNSKGTIGGTLCTAADIIFYYFIRLGEAYCIPAPALRAWADERLLAFPQKRVNTMRRDGGIQYDSFGHTVPIDVLCAELPGITKISGLPLFS